jgi:hypothetical protein
MDTLRSALARTVNFLPDLLAGLIVLAIGWLVGAILRSVVVAVLSRMGFDRFLAKHGVIGQPPERRAGSRAVGSATFWVVMLIALMQAAFIWRLNFVANGAAAVLAYVPNLIAAALIFGAAFIIGNWVGDRLRAGQREAYSTMLPGAVRAAILTIGAFLALRQLAIAPEILTIAFALVFGAIAVATALAFGLGGRDTARQMTEDWYQGQRTRRLKVTTPHGEELREPGEPPPVH